jgi:hypothetical protein
MERRVLDFVACVAVALLTPRSIRIQIEFVQTQPCERSGHRCAPSCRTRRAVPIQSELRRRARPL